MSKAAKFIILCLTLSVASGEPKHCHKGEYLDKLNDRCLTCPSETFQKLANHTNTDCANCTIANPNNHETVEEKCTTEKDTVRGCETGFYISDYVEGHEFYCQSCRSCSENQILIKECGEKQDTVCQNKASLETPTLNDLTSLPPSSGLTDGPHTTYNTTLSDGNSTDDHLKLFGIFCIAMSLLSLVPLFIVPLIYFADKTARHS